ncbi:hypothetical protein [uncultured Gammaproteobacteria bacterium]|nr:hypothetical protein [uncultured Gammaproteobacteria bacterium]
MLVLWFICGLRLLLGLMVIIFILAISGHISPSVIRITILVFAALKIKRQGDTLTRYNTESTYKNT